MKDKFELGKVEIKSKVTKDQIFAEQGKKPITFQEVQMIMGDDAWKQSLETLLTAFN